MLDLPGNPRIIAMPGHSPGSIAIICPAVDALFVGDALTTRHVLTGRRGPQPAPFTDEPRQALDSLTRLDGIRASWVLPGHGTPWTAEVDELLAQLRAAGVGPAIGALGQESAFISRATKGAAISVMVSADGTREPC